MLDIVNGNSNSFGILQSISDSKKENIGNQNHVLKKRKDVFKKSMKNFGRNFIKKGSILPVGLIAYLIDSNHISVWFGLIGKSMVVHK